METGNRRRQWGSRKSRTGPSGPVLTAELGIKDVTDTIRCKTHKIRTIRLWAVHMLPLPCSLTEHPPVDQWTQKSQAGNSARSYVFLPLSPGTPLRTRKPGITPPPYRHLSLSLSLLQGAVRELHPGHRGRWESAWCVWESDRDCVFTSGLAQPQIQ